MTDNFWVTIPGPAWGAMGILGAAVIAAAGAFVGNWMSNRNKAKVDAGQLALEYATGLRTDVDELKAQVREIQIVANAYRNHAHILHEWGGIVQTNERPRPDWPITLPR